MIFAPVVVFTYNRYKEIMEVITALANNIYAADTDVYVFSNAPIREVENDEEVVAKIRKSLTQFSGCFKHYEIVEREVNRGSNDNMIAGIDEIVNKYGRIIVLEDDILTAKNFLVFMNQALNKYEKDDNVFSICGYNPVEKECLLPGDSFSYDAFRSWGWAIWKDRWNTFDMKEDTISNIDLRKAHSEGLMYIGPIRYDLICRNNGAIRYLDFKLACKQMADKKTVIYSKKSLCDNIGMNGTGITSLEDQKYYNNNFNIEENQKVFQLSKVNLNIKSDPKYFFLFRQQEFAMQIYFELMFNRNFLYGNMYYALSYLYFKNYTIGYYFKKYNIHSVAIYGWGESGQYLYELLEREEIKILYAMDAREFPLEKRLAVYNKLDCLEEPECIIVSAIRDFAPIEEKLIQYFSCPILCMDDIIAECKRDLIDIKVNGGSNE